MAELSDCYKQMHASTVDKFIQLRLNQMNIALNVGDKCTVG